MEKGLLMVFTGDGKGKTTAALGMALRAAGHGMRVCFIQFIKGSWKYGEMEAVKRYDELIEFHVMGRGFTWKSDNMEEDRRLALEAWEFALAAMSSGKYHTVVLDEFTYLLNFHMVDVEACLADLAQRDEKLHVVVTGRYAPPELVAAADLVTNMQPVRHPYENGVVAQAGVEF
jgi:cob(I)alamin adenosyltransferase